MEIIMIGSSCAHSLTRDAATVGVADVTTSCLHEHCCSCFVLCITSGVYMTAGNSTGNQLLVQLSYAILCVIDICCRIAHVEQITVLGALYVF